MPARFAATRWCSTTRRSCNGATVVAGDTVIKGYGVVDNAQMTGNAHGHVVRASPPARAS